MQERVKYRNHLGEEIDFGRNGIYVKASELHAKPEQIRAVFSVLEAAFESAKTGKQIML